ncbi:hypothetical protein GPOL_c44290 [Gordonia polyisoprenivorans VH2]|uniref:Uncharacterized protein n=2 Tax=Gordonia polyisoprenivorans TaxID=84595 RepID=H6MWM1_GORPV|nr:hypothetical protein GPOL_c44290 [Gordonia polyisoprenivorans VH2]
MFLNDNRTEVTITVADNRPESLTPKSSVYGNGSYRDEVAALTADVDHVEHLACAKPAASSESRFSRPSRRSLRYCSYRPVACCSTAASKVVIGSLRLLLLMGVSALAGGWILDGHEHHTGGLHHDDE